MIAEDAEMPDSTNPDRPSRRSLLHGAALAAASGWLIAPALARQGVGDLPDDPNDKPDPNAPKPRTLVLVRHAEKAEPKADAPKDPDPSLSEIGKQRAEALVRMLGDAHFTHIWTSEYKRTQETAAPLAAKFGLKPVPFPARDVLGLSERLRGMPQGSIALVVGHSNTLPALVRSFNLNLGNLGGGTDLAENEFDRLVVVSFVAPEAPCALLEMRYGPPNPG